MYKAIFELSKDRADFVSMLFRSRGRPGSVPPRPPPSSSRPSPRRDRRGALRAESRGDRGRLLEEHAPAAARSATWTASKTIYQAFYRAATRCAVADVRGLMTATDRRASTAAIWPRGAFMSLKDLSRETSSSRSSATSAARRRFAPSALPEGAGATVGAFYLSNVEQYLVSGRQVGRLLPERRDAAARRVEHVHPLAERRRGGGRGGVHHEPWRDARRDARVRPVKGPGAIPAPL